MTAGMDLRTDTHFPTGKPIMDYLNEHGREGWELIAIAPKADGVFALLYFKNCVAVSVVV